MRERMEKESGQLGDVAVHRRKHRRYRSIPARGLPAEELAHEKLEESRKGHGNRANYKCSNPKCGEIRKDKWETHVVAATSDVYIVA